MLPEPLRQGFDISNQTPPDSLQNPATRPHQKSVHFKRNIPLPVVPGQVLAHCISMDTSWYRSNVEKMCRGHPGHPTPQKMPLPRKLWWRRIWVHPEDFKMDGDGWNTNPSKCPFWDGLWHWVYHMILNIRAWGCQSTQKLGHTGNEQNWDEQRTWGAGTVMQLQPHIFRGLCYWYPNGLLDLNAQIPAIMVKKAMGCHGMGRSDDLFWCGSLWSPDLLIWRGPCGLESNDSTDLQSKLPQMALIFTLSGQVISLHEPGIISYIETDLCLFASINMA